MEVRPGYKQTEVGVIPDDWELVSLREVTQNVIDNRGKTPPLAISGHPLLEANSIIDHSRGPDFSKVSKYVSDETYATWFRDGHPKAGDVLLVTVGSAGASCYITESKGCIAQNIIGVRPTTKCSGDFFYYYTQTPIFKRQVLAVLMGAVQPSLKVPHLMSFCLPLPPTKAEQEAIAVTLSDADALIESLEGLLAKKRQLKQGAMQELLTGKKRLRGFSEEWELRALGEIATANKGSQLSSSLMTEHGRFAHLNGGISPSGYTNKSNALGDTIAISEGGNSCGYVQFMSEPYCCGGHCYSVIPNGVDNRFLYHALKGEEPSIMGLRVGSGLPNVQKTALLAFNLRCPQASEEQTAIAVILSDMDAEVASLETKLAKASQIKQGMMQELLTGRIRLV
jgi:type I restriction enzyme, S subunit